MELTTKTQAKKIIQFIDSQSTPKLKVFTEVYCRTPLCPKAENILELIFQDSFGEETMVKLLRNFGPEPNQLSAKVLKEFTLFTNIS